jgi:hypothetical protein
MICSGRFSSIKDGGGTCTSGRRRFGPEGVGTTSGRGSEAMTPATTPGMKAQPGEPVARDTVFKTIQAPPLFVGEPDCTRFARRVRGEAEKAMRLELPKSSRERGVRRQAGARRPNRRRASTIPDRRSGGWFGSGGSVFPLVPVQRTVISGERGEKKDEGLLLELQFRPKLTPFDGSRSRKIRDFAVHCRVRIPSAPLIYPVISAGYET